MPDADARKTPERPLSPHLQIYRPQITTVLSILHRITGFGLAGGVLLVLAWLYSIVLGAQAYGAFYAFCKHPLGQAMLACWVWALAYHFLNGLRHLAWDTGCGVDIKNATRSGWAVVAGSIALTAWFWLDIAVK